MQEILTAAFSGTQIENDGDSAPIPLFPAHRVQGARQPRSRQLPFVHQAEIPCPEARYYPPPMLELDVSFNVEERALWCYMKPNGRPSFTLSMLAELNRLHGWLNQPSISHPLFYILGSRLPGIYNLGGDLGYFIDCIRSGDRAGLTRYAFSCVEAVHSVQTGFTLPIISIGLVEGDALGGGLEGALSFDILVAERGAKMGFPEVLFGLFPGMGAYSLLSRKIGDKAARGMMFEGRLYKAEEFHEMGIVDVLAPVGGGAAAVHGWIAENCGRHRLLHKMNQIQRQRAPVSLKELQDITLLWVDAAMSLDAGNLRRMVRLLAAQRSNSRVR